MPQDTNKSAYSVSANDRSTALLKLSIKDGQSLDSGAVRSV
jgi:hypothetical protein